MTRGRPKNRPPSRILPGDAARSGRPGNKARRRHLLLDQKHRDNPAIVTVFGAGVAGLTAAHELVTRGCIVQVIEKNRDAYARGRVQVGGMAATQYARIRANIEDLHPELYDDEDDRSDEQERLARNRVRQWLIQLFSHNRAWWIQTEPPANVEQTLFRGPKSMDPHDPHAGQHGQRKVRSFAKGLTESLLAARKRYRRRWLWDLIVRTAVIGEAKPYGNIDATVLAVSAYEEVIQEVESLDANPGDGSDHSVAEFLVKKIRTWLRGGDAHENEPTDEDFRRNAQMVHHAFEREFLCFRLIPRARFGAARSLSGARRLMKDWARHFESQGLGANLLVSGKRNARAGGRTARDETSTQKRNVSAPTGSTGTGPRDSNEPSEDEEVEVFPADKVEDGARLPPAWLELEIIEQRLPGEHGFRFFPSYYHHIDDTMKRIPLTPSQPGTRTVYDNFLPTIHQVIGMKAKDKSEARSDTDGGDVAHAEGEQVVLLRKRPTSVEGLREVTQRFWSRLGCTGGDAVYSSARLLRFMTSGEARRRQYEDISWKEFIGLAHGSLQRDREPRLDLGVLPYSPAMQDQLQSASQCVLALSVAEADARTYGAATVQLLMDMMRDGTQSDRTLGGPTSDAWLEPWREHLERLGVKFFVGEIAGFKGEAIDGKHELVPELANMSKYSHDGYELLAYDDERPGFRPDFYVMALDLEATSRLIKHASFHQCDCCPDFRRVVDFAQEVGVGRKSEATQPNNESGLKDMTGVQFFFDAKASIGKGHAYYPDSEWGLSSISQSEFWSERGGFADGYIGVLSVDISNTANDCAVETAAPGGSTEMLTFRAAQGRTPDGQPAESQQAGGLLRSAYGNLIASRAVWKQLNERTGRNDRLPKPRAFHVDENVKGTRVPMNSTPFLAAMPKTWSKRPGLREAGLGKRADIKYELNHDRWVLCGTHMATYTRMTSMEAANESGRHAARAILEKLREEGQGSHRDMTVSQNKVRVATGDNELFNFASRDRRFDPPDISAMEDREHEDLKFFKELDTALFDAGLPHWMDICDFDKRLELILRASEIDRAAGLERLTTAEDLIARTVASVETVLGRNLMADQYAEGTKRIADLVKSFLYPGRPA